MALSKCLFIPCPFCHLCSVAMLGWRVLSTVGLTQLMFCFCQSVGVISWAYFSRLWQSFSPPLSGFLSYKCQGCCLWSQEILPSSAVENNSKLNIKWNGHCKTKSSIWIFYSDLQYLLVTWRKAGFLKHNILCEGQANQIRYFW